MADLTLTREAIDLDRMEIEEAGPNPGRLAAAIHRQLSVEIGPVPVHAIAAALYIQEIRIESLANIEGALITTPERGFGSILVNGRSSAQRQRFTVSHELLHYLNPWHQPTSANGFSCSRGDVRIGNLIIRPGISRQQVQEIEANRFAIELLVPKRRLHSFLEEPPNLDAVRSIARQLDVSREAAARRYVELHEARLAIAFSHAHRLRYWATGAGFPTPFLKNGSPMPIQARKPRGRKLTNIQEADAADWLVRPDGHCVSVQTLHQQDGHAMTLVIVEATRAEDDDRRTPTTAFPGSAPSSPLIPHWFPNFRTTRSGIP